MMMNQQMLKLVLRQQENEITEHFVYRQLAAATKDGHNRDILQHIASDELRHYGVLRKYTNKDIVPRKWEVWKYYLFARFLGLNFSLKLMEGGEGMAQKSYAKLVSVIPEAEQIIRDEGQHEQKLIGTLHEEKLTYVGSIVLGLNDALVELMGTLAGLTLALQDTRVVAIAGIITGIAASFSMGASEYLSTKAEGTQKHPFRAALYTGLAYIVTVTLLVAPYLFFHSPYVALLVTVVTAIIIIAVFNFYISVAKDLSFRKRFFEMTTLSLSVAALSFGIGYVVRIVFDLEI